MDELLDPRLGGRFCENEVYCMVHAANLCIRRDPHLRPRMSHVGVIIIIKKSFIPPPIMVLTPCLSGRFCAYWRAGAATWWWTQLAAGAGGCSSTRAAQQLNVIHHSVGRRLREARGVENEGRTCAIDTS